MESGVLTGNFTAPEERSRTRTLCSLQWQSGFSQASAASHVTGANGYGWGWRQLAPHWRGGQRGPHAPGRARTSDGLPFGLVRTRADTEIIMGVCVHTVSVNTYPSVPGNQRPPLPGSTRRPRWLTLGPQCRPPTKGHGPHQEPSGPIQLPQALPPETIPLGARIYTQEFGGAANMPTTHGEGEPVISEASRYPVRSVGTV